MASTCLIRYRYPGTTNGRSVGDVYVTGPHFGTGVWSHTYRVTEAARFTEAEAQRRLQMHGWARNGGHIVPLTEATDLPDATGAA